MARNAVLSFGLVNVPVGVETLAKRNEPSFKTLHTCGGTVTQKRICDSCQEEVRSGETLSGYQFSKGQFLRFTPEEIEQAKSGQRSSIIAIEKFVPFEEVDLTTYAETTYWLRQNDTLREPYLLLREAMRAESVFGIGSASLWGKESPVSVWTDGAVLYLSIMFCAEDVTEPTRPEEIDVLEGNVALATQLVKAMTSDLAPEDLASRSRQRVQAMIQAKMAGEAFQAPAMLPDPEPTTDITAKLRESIERSKKEAAKA